jgi:TolA protein
MISQKVHELLEKQKHEQMVERQRQAEQIRRQQIAESARAEQEAKKAANEAMINQKVHELQEKQKHEQLLERQRQAEQIRRQQVAESLRAQQEAEQEANAATEELNELLRLPNSTSKGTNDSQKNDNTDKEMESNENPVEKGYLASISNRIQQFWALPEFEKWDPSLLATIVITINQDGRIIRQSFQEHSKNKLFDQYVEKTLQRAAPLPPIPAALKKSQFEIGLFFKPTGLQSKK